MLSCGRFQIPYRIFGRGEDIVCLNGAQQSMAMWYSFLQRFGDSYRITLFDFPHQGRAKVDHGSCCVTLDEQVEIMQTVVAHLGIKSATICSASWGGVIALLFALHFPELTRMLILASFGTKPNARMKKTIIEGVNTKLQDRQKMAEVLIKSFGDSLPEMIKKQIVAQFKNMSEERIRAFSEHGLSVIFHDSLDKIVPLSKIDKRTIILYGEEDKIIDIEDVKSLTHKMPDCQVRVIPGVGHFLHLEDEKVFKIYEEILLSNNLTPFKG